MTGKAGIGLGPEEPVSYVTGGYPRSDLGTGAGQIIYQPIIEFSDGTYMVDTEAIQMFDFLNSLDRQDVANIMQQLGIDFDKIRGVTKYEKLMECMAIVIHSRLRNELKKFVGDMSDDPSADSQKIDLQEQNASLTNLKSILDKEAERRIKVKMWLFITVSISFWLFILFLIWRLGWDVMEPWTYAIGIPFVIVQYLYFAITQRELSPPLIYQQLLKNEKQKKYQHYGLVTVHSLEILA